MEKPTDETRLNEQAGIVPPATTERDEGLDARIRWKLDVGIPLTAEERLYFARLPDQQVWPGRVDADGEGTDRR